MAESQLYFFVFIFLTLFTTDTYGIQENEKTKSDNKLLIRNQPNNNSPVKLMSVLSDNSSISSDTLSGFNSVSKTIPNKRLVNKHVVTVTEPPADWNGKDLETVIIPARFQTNYTQSVNISTQLVFIYNYTETNTTTAVRIHVSCDGATNNHPVMFSARQQEGILAWSVPLDQSQSYSYTAVSHTLCPVNKYHRQHIDSQQHIFVQVATSNPSSVMFHLNARLIDNFQLSHAKPRSVRVVTGQPKYYMYFFPKGVDQVLLRVSSKTDLCMVVSVQKIKCPVRDLENNIGFDSKHQTMTTQAALFLQRSDFDKIKGFYVVLLLRSNDEECAGKLRWSTIMPASSSISERAKTVEITIKKATTTKQYVIATLTAVGVLLGFYLMAFLMGFLYNTCGSHRGLEEIGNEERGQSETNLPNVVSDRLLPHETVSRSSVSKPTNQIAPPVEDERAFFNAQPIAGRYGSTEPDNDLDDDSYPPKEMGPVSSNPNPANSLIDTYSLNEEEIDFLADADSEKDIFRTKIAMTVSDLARKKRSKMNKYYNQYIWNLVSLAIFYALPVVQLVITYQQVLLKSGNEDICYYNFECANPLKTYLSSFNNVFSNIGYVMLGFLFIAIVRSRAILYSRAMEKDKNLATKKGIPQHYGIFYAMGFALVMEGVMSGSYHVCPNYSNFQFDTSFMYIIACLCMLQIYQNRHTDISAKSHTAYFSMAFVICIAVFGVVYRSNIFWIFYALVHMFSTFFLSAQVYYLGRWRIGWSFFKRYILFLVNDCRRCSPPVSPNRFIMLVIGNIINWTFALYGAIRQPADFGSYLLAIFIGNLLLYCMFYVIMKLLSKERISLLVIAVMLICVVLWGCSLYFFFQHITSWQKTPSGSREDNRGCILLDFYDSHDVWHFLSAFSLFFSFMILLLLDDDISQKPRDKIPVF